MFTTRLAFAAATVATASPRILVTGALGQLGVGLVNQLRQHYGKESVIASDIRKPSAEMVTQGPFRYLDVLSYSDMEALIVENRVDWVVHFSALLSAVGEKNPARALNVNLNGFQNVMELAKNHKLRVFCPSTIGAFGPSTPRDNTPDETVMRPTTIYGITKVHTELLGEYYHLKFGVDFRSVRYPGIISADEPGGGTTDYAIDIFHAALKSKKYECFLGKDSRLPMMYLPDCLDLTVKFLQTPSEQLKQRTYNVASFSFTPEELAALIAKRVPGFQVTYAPDFRQQIADSWPRSMDDSAARRDWGWNPRYNLEKMVDDMLHQLGPKYSK